MERLSTHAKGLLITGVGVLVLTPDTLLVRLISSDPWTIVFWRGALLALGLGIWFLAVYRRDAVAHCRAIGRPGLWASLLQTLGSIAFIVALSRTSVASTLFIVSTSPLFAALFSRWFLSEAIARRTWLAILVTLLGIAVIVSGTTDAGDWLGNLAALITAATMAGSFVIIRHRRHVNMIPAWALSGVLSALVVLPFAAPFALGLQDAVFVAIMGLVVLPISFALIALGPRYLPAPEVALLLLLETVLGPFWVWLVIGENPGSRALLGGAIVVAALALHAAHGLWRNSPLAARARG